jgi:two-component system cell cycle response regulator
VERLAADITGMTRARRTARVLEATALASALFVAAHALGAGGPALDRFAYDVVYDLAMACAAALCLLRAATDERERAAWLSIGLGLVAWTGAEVTWSLAYGFAGNPPSPNPTDVGYLLFYPAVYVGLGLLVRDRVRGFRASLWLDGVVEGLVAAALVAALLAGPALKAGVEGGPAAVAVAVNLAYPIGDMLLLVLVVMAFALCGWRPGRSWAFLGGGLAASALADVAYLSQITRGGTQIEHAADALWTAAVILIGIAAWRPIRRAAPVAIEGWALIAIPAGAAMTAAGLLTYAAAAGLDPVALGLAAAGLAAALGRMVLTFRENAVILAASRREALSDGLTGLGNRRALLDDLERETRAARATGERRVLVLFDLDGFKLYNDTFGHPAGDVLLARLGGRLAASVARVGAAYRMGGDEFCALVRVPAGTDPGLAVQAAARALSDQGEGFAVASSFGIVSIPDEADDPTEALQLADRRMYSQKDSRRPSATRQTRDALLQALGERRPLLGDHLREVAELARAVARRLELGEREVQEIADGAELHDVGKMAVPDGILDKPGALDEHEWVFIRQHTIVGERILAAAPSLAGVARLVRSSHERWDGRGYPDGLAGEAIPLGARVIAVCDAYDAMTSSRSYRDALEPAAALRELVRAAGSQFDPRVVDMFIEELRARPASSRGGRAARGARRPTSATAHRSAATGRR